MRDVEYISERGRKYLVRLPDDVGDEHVKRGVFIGPPDIVDFLGLPDVIATRLHNELYNRKLYTRRDVERRASELTAALQSALKVDVQRLHTAYHEYEQDGLTNLE